MGTEPDHGGRLRVGTCSWKYAAWEGLVYEPGDRDDYLAAYARRFDTVEVDQWFWSLHGPESLSLPKPRDVEAYARSVPEDFRFTVKAPNALTLTHHYNREKKGPLLENPHFLSPGLFGEFLERLAPMRGRLGPLMLQFEYLNREKMPSREAFFDRLETFLSGCPQGWCYAVELRNSGWLVPSFFDLLRRTGAAPVFLEGYWMPPVWEVMDTHLERVGPVAVVRLHGPDRQGIEERTGKQWDAIREPKDAHLPRVAAAVRGLLARGTDVYLNVNNHYEGCAPLTIERLRPFLSNEGL